DAGTVGGAAEPVPRALQAGMAALGGERQPALDGAARRARPRLRSAFQRPVAGDRHIVGKGDDEHFRQTIAPSVEDVALERQGPSLARTVNFLVAVGAEPTLLEGPLDFVGARPRVSDRARHQDREIVAVVITRMALRDAHRAGDADADIAEIDLDL